MSDIHLLSGQLRINMLPNKKPRCSDKTRVTDMTVRPPPPPPQPRLSLNAPLHFDGEPVSGTSFVRQRVTSIQADIPPIDLCCLIPQRWTSSSPLYCSFTFNNKTKQAFLLNKIPPHVSPPQPESKSHTQSDLLSHRPSSSHVGHCSSSTGPFC